MGYAITGALLIVSGFILILAAFEQVNIGVMLLIGLLGLGIMVIGYKLGAWRE